MVKGFLYLLAVVLVGLGGQGIARLLLNQKDAGLFGWLPGVFIDHLVAHIGLIFLGVIVAALAYKKK